MNSLKFAALVFLGWALGMAYCSPQQAHGAPPRAAWYCHPQGGSCVAAEPAAKPVVPYPRSRLQEAWAYTATPRAGAALHLAFTSRALCDDMRGYDLRQGARVSACATVSARRFLAKGRR